MHRPRAGQPSTGYANRCKRFDWRPIAWLTPPILKWDRSNVLEFKALQRKYSVKVVASG